MEEIRLTTTTWDVLKNLVNNGIFIPKSTGEFTGFLKHQQYHWYRDEFIHKLHSVWWFQLRRFPWFNDAKEPFWELRHEINNSPISAKHPSQDKKHQGCRLVPYSFFTFFGNKPATDGTKPDLNHPNPGFGGFDAGPNLHPFPAGPTKPWPAWPWRLVLQPFALRRKPCAVIGALRRWRRDWILWISSLWTRTWGSGVSVGFRPWNIWNGWNMDGETSNNRTCWRFVFLFFFWLKKNVFLFLQQPITSAAWRRTELLFSQHWSNDRSTKRLAVSICHHPSRKQGLFNKALLEDDGGQSSSLKKALFLLEGGWCLVGGVYTLRFSNDCCVFFWVHVSRG